MKTTKVTRRAGSHRTSTGRRTARGVEFGNQAGHDQQPAGQAAGEDAGPQWQLTRLLERKPEPAPTPKMVAAAIRR